MSPKLDLNNLFKYLILLIGIQFVLLIIQYLMFVYHTFGNKCITCYIVRFFIIFHYKLYLMTVKFWID